VEDFQIYFAQVPSLQKENCTKWWQLQLQSQFSACGQKAAFISQLQRGRLDFFPTPHNFK